MGGNHMNEFFRKKNDVNKLVVTPETEVEKLDRFLITVSESKVDIRRKILMLNKFIEALGKKED